jgi:hypothetical protein
MTRNMESAIAMVLSLALNVGGSFFMGHAALAHQLVHVFVIDASASGELNQGDSLSAVEDEHVSPSVLGLLAPSSPSAIARFVVAVGVNSIKRVAYWTRSHIGEKGRSARAPFFAHSNTSASVHLEPYRVRVVTPLFSLAPRTVFRGDSGRPSFTERRSVCSRMKPNDFPLEAATTTSSASQKVIPIDWLFGSAFTAAQPLDSSAPDIVRSAQHGQSPESLPGHVVFNGSHLVIVLHGGSEMGVS